MASRGGEIPTTYKRNIGYMCVIMGGSGSTGSSLVKNIMNRHGEIFAGEETSLFAKSLIYKDWEKAKRRIQKRKLIGLKNHGYHIYNGTDMVHKEYGYTEKDINKMAIDSGSLDAFCKVFYSKPLVENNAKIWIEKTPANAACFKLFLDYFQHGKVIHIVRNPYDTIASLWDRGYDLHYAVGIYLINTACGLSAMQYGGRYQEIKYEEVVQNTEASIRELCEFLGVKYDSDILTTKGEQIAVSKLSGWNYDETANIGTKALGRFDRLEDTQKQKLMEAIKMIKVSDAAKKMYNIDLSNIKDICNVLNYEYQDVSTRSSFDDLKNMLRKDRLERIRRGYMTGMKYPLGIELNS